jgi:peptidyl-tRNA hydrolase, PTH1 family
VKMIAGLGNPGAKYRLNRHNMGFLVLDRLAETNGIAIGQRIFEACIGKGFIAGQPVLLAKPQTFMNLSGIAVRKLFDYFRIDLQDLIIVHDDLDLPFETVRAKAGGGAGGHKGLISISDHLGTQDFKRVRLGIGKPERREMVESYVLSPFSPDEMARLPDVIMKSVEILTEMLSSGIQSAMSMYHGKNINNFNEEV